MGRRGPSPTRQPRFRRARTIPVLALCFAALAAASSPATSPVTSPSSSAGPSPVVSIAASASVEPSPLASATPPATARPLVFAYYYIWYAPTSWRRAKIDLPQLGAYDSRDRAVIAQHLAWAHQAGIDGLSVSWKHEPRLDDALRVLVDEATKSGMKLILLYQGLNFDRQPLDPNVVASDLEWFLATYGDAAPFNVYGLPTIVWSGTWGYKDSELQLVRTAIGAPGRALLLGSERSAAAYGSRAAFFDGDAYYWSSPDPLSTPGYQRRLDDLAAAVRQDSGKWVAPAAPGFDARLVGGTSIVSRRDGATYRAAWNGALQTRPDVLGIISWNEFSENSQIEPSRTYGTTYLDLTTQLIAGLPATSSPGPSASASGPSQPPISSPLPSPVTGDPTGSGGPTNLWGAVLGVVIAVALVLVGRSLRRRSVG